MVDRGWAKGKAMTHAGSNTMWYALVWVAPKIGRIYFVVVNSWDSKMGMIGDGVIGELIRLDLRLRRV